jgi:hypothetical protein
MPTAPSTQIAKAAIITPQPRAIRKTDWSTNRTINSIAQPKTAKMAAAAMKSAPVQRTSSVNNIPMAGRRSKTPRIAQRAGRQRPRLAARELVDTVTDTLHRRYFHMRLECLQVGERTLPYGFRPDPHLDIHIAFSAPQLLPFVNVDPQQLERSKAMICGGRFVLFAVTKRAKRMFG